MTLYGYARVSVREPEDKNLDLQVDRLRAYWVETGLNCNVNVGLPGKRRSVRGARTSWPSGARRTNR